MYNNRRITCLISSFLMISFFVFLTAFCESASWDCPKCGRTGNTGNYCGTCAYPAPWIENKTDETPDFNQDFKTIGNVVTFGQYEQDNNETNGKEPIEWIVLDYDEKNHRVLLISQYGLTSKAYNNKYMQIDNMTWENCTLRSWLNDDFINYAFSSEEQKAILITEVDNSKRQGYSGWDTLGGNNTKDRIFLLSYAEANHYYGVAEGVENVKARVAITAFANSPTKGWNWSDRGYKTEKGEPAWQWRLRSPGFTQSTAALISDGGGLCCGDVVSSRSFIRPVFWLNLDSDIF